MVTTNRELAEQVSKEVDTFVASLSRKEIISKSLENYGYLLIADNMDEAIDVVNELLPSIWKSLQKIRLTQ